MPANSPPKNIFRCLHFVLDKDISIVYTMHMKTKNYIMRLTEKEYNELKKRAGKLGLTVAAYIRMKTLYEPEEKKGKK